MTTLDGCSVASPAIVLISPGECTKTQTSWMGSLGEHAGFEADGPSHGVIHPGGFGLDLTLGRAWGRGAPRRIPVSRITVKIRLLAYQAPKIHKSGVRVSGLSSVDENTAVVTKAGSASYSVARMVESTAVGIDASSIPAL